MKKDNYYYSKAISMEEFLINYLELDYFVDSNILTNLMKCSHKDLKAFNIEGVKTVNKDYVDVDQIESDEILIVRSGKRSNELGFYKRPELVLDEITNKTR